MALPVSSSRRRLKVEPREVPQGKQAAGVPLKNLVPLTPLGPSERRRAGMPCLGRAFVCQKSVPVEDPEDVVG
jgi:hypothetical protein